MLKGASGDELKKLKHVVQYGSFAAYHLALETSFLADEGASLPEFPLKTPIRVALREKPVSNDRSTSTIFGLPTSSFGKPQLTIDVQAPKAFHPLITSTNSGNMETTISSLVSPVGTKNSPGGMKDQVSTFFGLFSNPSQDYSAADALREKNKACFGEVHEVETIKNNDPAVKHDPSIIPNHRNLEPIDNNVIGSSGQIQNKDTTEEQLASASLGNTQLENDQKTEQTSPKEEFAPDHLSILVSLSTRSVWKGSICERSQLFRIKYYGSFDKPLGRFLRDNLFDQVDFSFFTC